MDASTLAAAGSRAATVRVCTGTWRKYLPIAATNVAADDRHARASTASGRPPGSGAICGAAPQVIGDSLEWSGTGKEMFIGFLIVMAILHSLLPVHPIPVPGD